MNLPNPYKKQGFTLVEIMIVVAIIAMLAAIAIPGFLRARKRSQATTVLNTCRLLEAAKDQYAVEYSKTSVIPTAFDLAGYLKDGSQLYNACKTSGWSDSSGYGFAAWAVNDPKVEGVWYDIADTNNPIWMVGVTAAFSDVVDSTFWSPFRAD